MLSLVIAACWSNGDPTEQYRVDFPLDRMPDTPIVSEVRVGHSVALANEHVSTRGDALTPSGVHVDCSVAGTRGTVTVIVPVGWSRATEATECTAGAVTFKVHVGP